MKGCVIDPDIYRDVDLNVDLSTPKLCEVLFVGLSRTIDDRFISAYPRLKYVVCPTTAVDHILIHDSSIEIIHLDSDQIKDIRASSEFALLLILSLMRKSPLAFIKGRKIQVDRSSLVGEDVYGKTLGILGNGRIGSHVGNFASAMGAKIMAHDRIKEKSSFSKEEVLNQSDIVLLSISADGENRDYINRDELGLMKHGCYFINISRWFTVHEMSLLASLKSGHIKAAVDVVSENSPLLDYDGDNLIVTPHVAGSTLQSQKKACEYVLSKLKRIGQ